MGCIWSRSSHAEPRTVYVPVADDDPWSQVFQCVTVGWEPPSACMMKIRYLKNQHMPPTHEFRAALSQFFLATFMSRDKMYLVEIIEMFIDGIEENVLAASPNRARALIRAFPDVQSRRIVQFRLRDFIDDNPNPTLEQCTEMRDLIRRWTVAGDKNTEFVLLCRLVEAKIEIENLKYAPGSGTEFIAARDRFTKAVETTNPHSDMAPGNLGR